MKLHMMLGTLVLGLSLCTQSFGFDLLDRMLGTSGCGCTTKCCAAPSCGCDNGCASNGCCDPGCGPSCGCDNGCATNCCAGKSGCCEPACGCDNGCAANGCCDNGCTGNGCAPACGCEHGAAPAPAVGGDDMAPMPPAPVVDPSAYLSSQRRVIQASTNLVR
ncbi:MAG: hypothetical protein KDA38_00040 [Planctomycetales bacterium]|nr:hypothetical protein [Planctomycetales bacterium]